MLDIPENYGNATLKWTYVPLGRQVSCTIGYFDQMLADNPTDAATDIRAAAVAVNAPCNAAMMYSSWRFDGVSVLQRLSSGILATGVNSTPVTGTVTPAAGPQPLFAPQVISKNTAFAGRQYRGRMYVPALLFAEGNVTEGGSLDSAVVTFNQAAWSEFIDNLADGDYGAVLLHTVPPSGPATPPTTITSITARSVVGIQRRRRNRGA